MSSISSGQSLGSLGVNVEVFGVNKVNTDLNKVERSFKKSKEEVKKSGNEIVRHGAKSRKLSFVLLELSRGAEDFAIGFGINGMSGAIRGASNNMSQMGAIISPLLGTIAGFGSASLAMIPIFIGIAKRAKEAGKEIDTFSEALQRRNKIIEQGLKIQFDIADIVQGGDVKGAQQKLLDAQRQLKIEQVRLGGLVPEIAPGGIKRDRDIAIRNFADEVLAKKNLFLPEEIRNVFPVLMQLARNQGIDPTGGFDENLARVVSGIVAEDMREQIRAGGFSADEIEKAVREVSVKTRQGNTILTDFNESLGSIGNEFDKTRKNVSLLEQAVRSFSQAAKDAEKSPAGQKKLLEKQQKEATKVAKDEESRLGKRRDLFGSLLNVFDPKRGKLFDINERRIAREKQIAGFDIPDAEKRRFTIAARQVAAIERRKVFDDEQMKVGKAREKEVKFQKKIEDDKKRNVDAARGLGLGFVKQFLPKDVLRKIELQERLRRISDLKGVSPEIKGNLRELAALTLSEAEKKKPSAQFAGPVEFAKQFQLQISKKTDPVEKNTAEAVKLLKKINASIKKGQEGPLFQ